MTLSLYYKYAWADTQFVIDRPKIYIWICIKYIDTKQSKMHTLLLGPSKAIRKQLFFYLRPVPGHKSCVLHFDIDHLQLILSCSHRLYAYFSFLQQNKDCLNFNNLHSYCMVFLVDKYCFKVSVRTWKPIVYIVSQTNRQAKYIFIIEKIKDMKEEWMKILLGRFYI